MDWKLGGLILLLAGCASAQTAPRPATHAAAQAWKTCLFDAVDGYAKAAPTFDDAHLAADSKCADQHRAFIRALWQEPGASHAYVDRMLDNFNSMLRVDLTRVYVEARGR